MQSKQKAVAGTLGRANIQKPVRSRFIAAHVHFRSVFENTVVFQVDLQTGTVQSVCGIPHQIEPFKNRLLLRWAVILRDANNNFNFLHTIDNPPQKPKSFSLDMDSLDMENQVQFAFHH